MMMQLRCTGGYIELGDSSGYAWLELFKNSALLRNENRFEPDP